MKVPAMGDSITSGSLVSWEKKVGDYVALDDIVAVIETDKVSVDVRASTAGILEEQLAAAGSTVEVGSPLIKIKPAEKPAGTVAPPSAPSAPAPSPAASPAPATPSKPAAAAPAPPAAAASAAKPPSAPKAASPATAAAPSNPVAFSRSETRVAMSRMRQRIAQRLKESQNTAAMLTTFQEVDMSAVFELREKYKEQFEKIHGVKLGFMSPFLKASAAALKELPAVNAVIEGDEIVYRDYVDVSVAVASPRGLVVPVVRNVESLSLADIERTLAELAKKAKNDSISIEDMAGGTFTVSNGGVFGSMMGTPIINPPQSAILGMHSIKQRVVVVNVSK
jgi:2-oxoglutarate dehydrogenase E2 component (dihydrolipoamide succinyltransferase)